MIFFLSLGSYLLPFHYGVISPLFRDFIFSSFLFSSFCDIISLPGLALNVIFSLLFFVVLLSFGSFSKSFFQTFYWIFNLCRIFHF